MFDYTASHQFKVNVAIKFGVHSAIILNYFAYWTEYNKANNKNFYDGYYWTYCSRKALADLYPYLTPRQIKYATEKLIDAGVIITGNYNKSPYD